MTVSAAATSPLHAPTGRPPGDIGIPSTFGDLDVVGDLLVIHGLALWTLLGVLAVAHATRRALDQSGQDAAHTGATR